MKVRVDARHLAREAGVFTLFVALSVMMTWPLTRHMDRAVSDAGDPFINTFILAWTHHSLTRDPSLLFHAPIFHPHPYTLAFSENLLGIAIPTLPLSRAGLDPLLIYNIAFLAGFAFSGWAAYTLGRMLTGSVIAGLGSGFFFAFLPWRFIHLSHLQHQWAGWLPLIVASLVYYWRSPSFGRAGIVAIVFAANGATNLHWFAFSLVAAPAVALILGARFLRRDALKMWAHIAGAFVAGCLVLLPILIPYARAREIYGPRSAVDDPAMWSAIPSDWIAVAPGSNYASFMDATVPQPERWLFPGLVPSAIVLLGVLALLFFRPPRASYPPYAVGLALFGLGFSGSLGENGYLHRWLADALPVFDAIRAPARWAMIGYLGMAILIPLMLQRMQSRGRTGALIASSVIVLMLIEFHQAPIRYWLAPSGPDALATRARELRDQVVIAWLPLDQGSQYHRMLEASRHLAPMVNGVSGFDPPAFRQLTQSYMSGKIDADFTRALLDLGATVVVITPDSLYERSDAVNSWVREEMARGRLRPLAVFPSDAQLGNFAFGLFEGSVATESDVPGTIRSWAAGEPRKPPGFFAGYLHEPYPNQSVHGELRFSGWAVAREPISRVLLHLDNGARAFEAERSAYDAVHRHVPGFEHEALPGFSLTLDVDQRKQERSDVEVEIITESGRSERFGYRWFDWRE